MLLTTNLHQRVDLVSGIFFGCICFLEIVYVLMIPFLLFVKLLKYKIFLFYILISLPLPAYISLIVFALLKM